MYVTLLPILMQFFKALGGAVKHNLHLLAFLNLIASFDLQTADLGDPWGRSLLAAVKSADWHPRKHTAKTRENPGTPRTQFFIVPR